MVLFGVLVAFLACSSVVRLHEHHHINPALPTHVFGEDGIETNFTVSPYISGCLIFRPLHFVSAHPASMTKSLVHSHNNVSRSFLLLLAGDISSNPGPSLKFGLCNIRSIRKNHTTSSDFIKSNDITILSLTETWLTDKESPNFIKEITPSGYDLHHVPRFGRSGGGVGLLINKSFACKQLSTPTFHSFEHILVQCTTGINEHINFATVYRPPSLSMAKFLEQFNQFLELLQSMSVPTIISHGDFNIYVEKDCYPADQFKQMLSDLSLVQHVNFETNLFNHTLDLIISPGDSDMVSNVRRSDCLTDHFTVVCDLNISQVKTKTKTEILYRCYSKIDKKQLTKDLIGF